MNSSTSIFDSVYEARWRRVLCQYAAWTLGLGLLLAVLAIGLDPYDTGRFALFGSHGVPKFGQRMVAASLARQPHYDMAIIGNSAMQLLDPAQFEKYGRKAVSLAMPGTGPKEQLVVAEWFIKHHPNYAVLVFGIDDRWCESGHSPRLTHPFPFWLYGGDTGDYLSHVLEAKNLEAAIRKLKIMSGLDEPLRADGYNDYDTGKTWDRAGFRERLNGPNEEGDPQPLTPPPYRFEAAPILQDFLMHLPLGTRVILIVPPQYRPPLKGDAVLKQNACEATYRDVAAHVMNAQFINFNTQKGLTYRDVDYWDRLHYRARVAREMEKKIGKILN
ncbi:MAG: hypothetical protein AB7H77_04105 [Bdellovibrionales bacterium]